MSGSFSKVWAIMVAYFNERVGFITVSHSILAYDDDAHINALLRLWLHYFKENITLGAIVAKSQAILSYPAAGIPQTRQDQIRGLLGGGCPKYVADVPTSFRDEMI